MFAVDEDENLREHFRHGTPGEDVDSSRVGLDVNSREKSLLQTLHNPRRNGG